MYGTRPFDGHLEGNADIGIERGQGRLKLCQRDTDGLRPHAIEGLAVLEGGGGAALDDRVDDGSHLRHHRVDVDPTARQYGTQPGRR